MGERAGNQSTEETTRDTMSKYNRAALGWHDIHTFSYDGEVQAEILTAGGGTISDNLLDLYKKYGRNSEGMPVSLEYDGVMSKESFAELADSLQAQLEAANEQY